MKKSYMVRTILFLIPVLFMFSYCVRESERELSEEQKQSLIKEKNDSLLIYYDSLAAVKVELPPLIDNSIIDSTSSKQFIQLAKATDGKFTVLVNAKRITQEIKTIISERSAENSDILLLIDKTGSMWDDLKELKRGIADIISALKGFKNNRLAIAFYGDKNVDGKNWFTFYNFENSYDDAKEFIKTIKVTGGDDFPESVYDGLFAAFEKDFFRSESKRLVILVGDAPSLLPPLSEYTLEDVIKSSKENKININFYPILISPLDSVFLSLTPHMEDLKLIDNIFPNPSNGTLKVDFVKENKYSIELFNESGSMVFSEQVTGKNYRKELYHLENGLYILRVYDEHKNYDTKKIILQK